MLFEELEFIGKPVKETKEKAPETKDIKLRICKDQTVNISLRTSAIDKVLKYNKDKEYERLMFAFKDGRFYLKGTNNPAGFKASINKLTDIRYCRVKMKYFSQEAQDWLTTNEGKYNLILDADSKLYYIEGNGIKFILRG